MFNSKVDLVSIFVVGVLFFLVFYLISIALEKIHYPFTPFIYALIAAWAALYWPRPKKVNKYKKIEQENYEIGTNRKPSRLDKFLDQHILQEHYQKHDEKRTPERDKEILKKTYLKPKRD